MSDTRRIRSSEIALFMQRFPNLSDFGLMDEAFAIACLGADKLGCRPCDVRVRSRTEKQTFVEIIR